MGKRNILRGKVEDAVCGVQFYLVKLCELVAKKELDPDDPVASLRGANAEVVEVKEVAPEWGWRTYEVKVRVVINMRPEGPSPLP